MRFHAGWRFTDRLAPRSPRPVTRMPAGQCVLRRHRVGVFQVTADSACELRLALEVVRMRVSADGARHRCVRSRLGGGSPGGGSHARGVEVFENHEGIGVDDVTGRLGVEIPAPITNSAHDRLHLRPARFPSIRSPPGSGRLLFKPPRTLGLISADEATVEEPAIAGGGEHDHPTVHSDTSAPQRHRGLRRPGLHEEADVPVLAIAGHCGRLHRAAERAGPAEADPPDFRQTRQPPFTACPLDREMAWITALAAVLATLFET